MKNLLYDLKTKKIISKESLNKNTLKAILEKNAFELFRIKIIVSNYTYNPNEVDTLEELGIDENNQLVLFEIKIGKLNKTIQNAFHQIDYIKKHVSEFKILMNDAIGIENAKKIDYNPRIIVVGDHFSKYDYDSVKGLPYIVELDEVMLLSNNQLLMNHTYVNKQSDLSGFLVKIEGKEKDLFLELRNYIFALGEEIFEYGRGNVICYRRLYNFAFVYFSNGLHLCLKDKDYLVNDFDIIDELREVIEEEYDQN